MLVSIAMKKGEDVNMKVMNVGRVTVMVSRCKKRVRREQGKETDRENIGSDGAQSHGESDIKTSEKLSKPGHF